MSRELTALLWVLVGGIIIWLGTTITIDRNREAPVPTDVQPIECVPSHEPTGYGPEDAY